MIITIRQKKKVTAFTAIAAGESSGADKGYT